MERRELVERREGNLQSGCKINEKLNFIKEKKRDTLFFLLRLQIKISSILKQHLLQNFISITFLCP